MPTDRYFWRKPNWQPEWGMWSQGFDEQSVGRERPERYIYSSAVGLGRR